jgi:hypothetical protein
MSDNSEYLSPHPSDNGTGPGKAPESPQTELLPWLYALGFVVLAIAIWAAWQYPRASVSPAVHGLEQRLADVDARLSRLEQSAVAPADLSKLSARIDALESKGSEQTNVGSRIDALSGRVESLSGRIQAGLDADKQQEDRLAARVAGVEKNVGSVDAVSGHLNQLTRIQEAAIALASGRPVGDIPDAPPALTRFAHEAPPTEVELRLLFTKSEQTAIAAKQPDEATHPFIDRVWERAQDLVTVHRGDEVMVGNPASVTLGHARVALDAGDLKGAIGIVESLKGQPRQAMDAWLAEAKSLVDARAALASLAGPT